MLIEALRRGTAVVRRAGLPTALLALVAALPDLLPTADLPDTVQVGVFPVVGLLRTVLFLTVIRLLGAHRPEPVPPPPAVDASGVRTVTLSVVAPVGDDDGAVRVALRNAARLSRPALRLFGLSLLATIAAAALTLGLLAGSGTDAAELGSRDPVVVVPHALISALLIAFVVLADHRVALEGDPRVLLAAAHSVGIAGASFGTVFALTVLATVPGAAGALLPHGVDALPVQGARVLVGALIQLVVLAALNEVFVRGPRADLVVDAATRADPP